MLYGRMFRFSLIITRSRCLQNWKSWIKCAFQKVCQWKLLYRDQIAQLIQFYVRTFKVILLIIYEKLLVSSVWKIYIMLSVNPKNNKASAYSFGKYVVRRFILLLLTLRRKISFKCCPDMSVTCKTCKPYQFIVCHKSKLFYLNTGCNVCIYKIHLLLSCIKCMMTIFDIFSCHIQIYCLNSIK